MRCAKRVGIQNGLVDGLEPPRQPSKTTHALEPKKARLLWFIIILRCGGPSLEKYEARLFGCHRAVAVGVVIDASLSLLLCIEIDKIHQQFMTLCV
jgi:hypothetical protein